MILRMRTRESYQVFIRTVTTPSSRVSSLQTAHVSRAKEKNTKNLAKPSASRTSDGIKSTKEPPAPIKTSELNKVRQAQKLALVKADKRKQINKATLRSYLGVCVDVDHTSQACNLLLKHMKPKRVAVPDVKHYNIILRGLAQKGNISLISETRSHMHANGIEPNSETYAHILLGYCKTPNAYRRDVNQLLEEMKSNQIDVTKLFQTAYLNQKERASVRNLLKAFNPMYDDIFCDVPIDYDCRLLENLEKVEERPHDLAKTSDLAQIEFWAEQQRLLEWKSSVSIKSIAKVNDSDENIEKYSKQWRVLHEIWKKALTKSLDEYMKTLHNQFLTTDKIHLYPYLCSIDRNLLVNIMLDEVETNAVFSKFSMSTNSLHSILGSKVMTRYMRAKTVADGSNTEQQTIYNKYITEYCRNPKLMAKMNSREYIQAKAIETKNYSIYRDKIAPIEPWPNYIISSVGRFLYGIILREIKFDPEFTKKLNEKLDPDRFIHAFYTAYFQIDNTHKIKEEFRAHQDFEAFHRKATCFRLRFDYSYLPMSCPPMPWLSSAIGGYLTNKSDLVRMSFPNSEPLVNVCQDNHEQKLYPSLDSLNVLGLCPWIVNKEILDLVIEMFRAGGNADLSIPLDESKMIDNAPVLKDNDSKANRILYNKEKKRYDQKRREMYSLWRDCLYRLSIANHFRNKIFWFPHNMDFRGRTYPIPPHFNHLGADLARSLLLFAKGRPLGEKGLDWLKIHLINLVGNMKRAPIQERLEYANSILHLEVLDSADNPLDGRRWWTQNESPWQVLACCKEIAKAIRSKDFRQYISHFPVHQDGSCNGLQHYAALGRDPEGALAVNLVPSDRPQDVYSRVVEIVEETRKRDAEKGLKVAANLEGFIQRKVIKQTVMTTVYGVTRYGARQQIARQLSAKGFPEQEIWSTSQYLVTNTFKSIGKMFSKSRLIQDWFTHCASIIAGKYRQPVSWETPLGFLVVQPYIMMNKITTNRLISPIMWFDKPSYYDPLAQLNVSKQRTAFPPNYIHSLDSSHMMLTSLYCRRQGVTFVSVHDCYWTHPSAVDTMNSICRQQFVAMHSEPLLNQLSEQFIKKFETIEIDEPKINKTSIIGNYHSTRKAVKNKVETTFADVPSTGDLDLDVVLKSTYFFS